MSAESPPPAAPTPKTFADLQTAVIDLARQHAAKLVLAVVSLVIGWATKALTEVPKTVEVLKTVEVPVPMKSDPLDHVPYNYEGTRFDGGPEDAEHVERDGKPWPTTRLTYWIDYDSAVGMKPPLSRDAISGEFRTAWNWIAEGVVIEPVELPTPDAALVRIRFGRIDGVGGTLAWSYLSDGTLKPKDQLYDLGERWVAGMPTREGVALRTVACHEIIHALGLSHDDPTAAAVMRPSYSASIPREQARDYDRLVKLGYKRREKAPAGPVDILSFPVQARTADVVEALDKAGFKVEKK